MNKILAFCTPKLKVAWVFIQDHTWLAILGAIAIFVFFKVGSFKELAYGALRAIIGVLIISAVLYAWFRSTGQSDIVNGSFTENFKTLEAKHRVWLTFAMIALCAWIVIECLVHP